MYIIITQKEEIMSVQIAEDFFKEAEKHKEAWQHEMERQYSSMTEDNIAAFAKTKGFNFSVDELVSYMETKVEGITDKLDNGELSEEQLESVVGGAGGTICTVWYHWPCN